DGLLVTNPDNPEALYASALLAMQMGDWTRAQDTMARIPAASRTPNMVATAQQIDFQVVVAQASQAALEGNLEDARSMLARLEPAAGQDPAKVGALAQAYVDAGNTPRAMSLMHGLMPNGLKGSGPEVQLAYLGLLLKTGQNVQAGIAMRELHGEPLTADQRQQLDELNYLYTVRLADQQRQQGDLALAYDTLAPILAKRPNDSLATAALARMYAADDKYDEALSLYQKALANDPGNPGLQLGVAMAAVQAGKGSVADAALKQAVAKAPNDPDVLAGAARIYVMQGKTREAQSLLESAIAAKEKRLGVQAQDVHVAGNPFVHDDDAHRRQVRNSRQPAVGTFGRQAAASDGMLPDEEPGFGSAAAPASTAASATGTGTATAASVTSTAARERGSSAPSALPTVAGTPVGGPAPQDTAAVSEPQDASPSLEEMGNELSDLRAQRSPEVKGGLFVSSNNAAPGAGQVTSVQQPLEGVLPVDNGKLSIRVTPVELEGGTLGTDVFSASQFGGGPAATQAQLAGKVAAPGKQTAYGVGLGLGYETGNWMAD
ncbi:MAG TPA: tetratricopeptide repeat protein, partial [Chloroflexota bacterium]